MCRSPMETEHIIDPVNLKTSAQSESTAGESTINTTVPSQERPKVCQIESNLDNLFQTFDEATSIFERAKRKRYDLESVIQDKTNYLEAELSEEKDKKKYLEAELNEEKDKTKCLEAELTKERELCFKFQASYRHQSVKHERQVDILVIDIDNKRKELECLRKDAHEDREKKDRESMALVIAIKGLQQKLTAEQEDKKKLEQAYKTHLEQVRGDFEELRRELRQMVRKKDDLEDQLVAMRKERIQLENVHETIHKALKKATEDKRKLEQAQKAELISARRDYGRLRLELRKSVAAKAEVEKQLITAREEKEHLGRAHEAVMKSLEDEKEKSLCQICYQLPIDSTCMPCLHFNYCSVCLRKHRQRNDTCPSCRGVLSGVLESFVRN